MVHRPLRRPSFQLASHMRKRNVETQRGCDGNTAGILKTDYLANRLLANFDPPISCLWPIPHKTAWSLHIHKNTQFMPTRPATTLHMIHRCIYHEITHSHTTSPNHPTPSHYYILLHFFEDIIRRHNFQHILCVKEINMKLSRLPTYRCPQT